jgi:YgiT-type zinc finger domain-containing protein
MKKTGKKTATGNCSICGIGKLRGGRATVTLERGGSVVVIRGVPARICPACGEYYLTSAVTDKVMKRAEQSIANGAEVGIIRYAA